MVQAKLPRRVQQHFSNGWRKIANSQVNTQHFHKTINTENGGKMKQAEMKNIKIADLVSSDKNPRKHFDEVTLHELATSILEKGLLQPIIVRPKGKKFEIVAGERRFRASKIAELKEIPCIVRELTDEEAFDLMITENLQREDVQPMEEAAAFNELLKRNNDFSMLAVRFGKSEVYVRLRVKLLDLISDFQELLEADVISISIAQELCKQQDYIQEEIYKDSFTDRDKSWWKCPRLHDLKNSIKRNANPLLSEAKFDITDKKLKKDAGACTNCVSNTACLSALFPEDTENARCTNPRCFKQKTEIAFEKTLESVSKDSSIIIGHTHPHWDNDRNDVTKLEKLGYSVVDVSRWSRILEPDAPDMPEESNYDLTDLEEAAEFSEEMELYKADLAEYENEKKEYESKMADPQLIKVFVVNKGCIEYFEASAQNEESGSQIVKNSVHELELKLKRNNELEVENSDKEITKFLQTQFDDKEDKTVLVEFGVYQEPVAKALKVIMLLECGWKVLQDIGEKYAKGKESDVRKTAFDIVDEISDADWNLVVKDYLLRKLGSTAPFYELAKHKTKVEISRFVNRDVTVEISNRHYEKYNKRNANIEAQINELKRPASEQQAEKPAKKSKKIQEPAEVPAE